MDPRCICTGSLWSCTLHCSSGPLGKNEIQPSERCCTHLFGTLMINIKSAYLVHLAVVTVLLMQIWRALKKNRQVTDTRVLVTMCTSVTKCTTQNDKMKKKTHLSRVSGAGLRNVTVVDGVAATVAPRIKLASGAGRGQNSAPPSASAAARAANTHVPDTWSCSTGRRCSERRWPGSTSCNTPCSTPGKKQTKQRPSEQTRRGKHTVVRAEKMYLYIYFTHRPPAAVALLSHFHKAVATLG